MEKKMTFNYFYGTEADQFSFYKESTVPDTMSRLPLAVCVTCVSDLAISATSSSNAPIIATVFIPIRKFLSQHFRLPLSGELAAEWRAEG